MKFIHISKHVFEGKIVGVGSTYRTETPRSFDRKARRLGLISARQQRKDFSKRLAARKLAQVS